MGGGVVGVERYRPVEVLDRPRQVFLGQPPEVMLTQQVLLVRPRIDRAGRSQPGTLFCSDPNLDLSGNRARHLALQLQDVGQVSLVFTGPEMCIGRGVNQLDADLHAIAAALHRAFYDGVDIQRARNFRERTFGAFEPHHRRARDDAERADSGKIADEGLGHSVSEVLLLGVARQIVQRQHRQRGNRRSPRYDGRRRAQRVQKDSCGERSKPAGHEPQP
jgi:hypothetical protein